MFPRRIVAGGRRLLSVLTVVLVGLSDGIAAIQQLGQQHNFTVDTTEDDTQFTDANLARYDVVIFLSTTGDPLGTQAEKDAFQRYIEHGGGHSGEDAATGSRYQGG